MDRFERQANILSPTKLSEERIILVGAGAVGRQVGLLLAAAGAQQIRVIDFDQVEPVNIATQGYTKEDLGKKKADVLSKRMADLDLEGNAKFEACVDMWRPRQNTAFLPTVLFSCVDNMEARKSIFNFFQRNDFCRLLIDGRMLGETIRFLTATRTNLSDYEKTLNYTDEEAEQGRCTARSTYYASSILASMLVRQLSLDLRGAEPERDQMLNLLSLDFFTPKR